MTFAGDPTGYADPQATGGATFSTAPLAQDVVLAGVPQLRLSASVTAPRVHLIANLYDETPDGDRRRLSQCAINPELRGGSRRASSSCPAQRYDMAPPCFAIAHHLRAGHKLVLRVTTSDPDKVPLFAVDPQVTVFTGAGATQVTLPVVPGATLHPDAVALRGRGRRGPRAGPDLRDGDADARPAGARRRHDDRVLRVRLGRGLRQRQGDRHGHARPAPADVDLYLQRRNANGTWSGDLATGGTSDLASETMTTGRLAPGRYRVEVHNWLGLPGTAVALRITFYNTAGAPGA